MSETDPGAIYSPTHLPGSGWVDCGISLALKERAAHKSETLFLLPHEYQDAGHCSQSNPRNNYA